MSLKKDYFDSSKTLTGESLRMMRQDTLLWVLLNKLITSFTFFSLDDISMKSAQQSTFSVIAFLLYL